MKVLFVSMGFYPAVEMGGVVSVTYNWTRLLAERGHEVHVACSNRVNRRRKLFAGTRHSAVDGVQVHYFDTHVLPFWPGTFGPAFSLAMLLWMFRSVRLFDVVHIHEFRTFPTV